uniref:Large ribosomal subunit protein eL27 n=3 Tax=Timema TaxID=61471 RepID=A0A7R9EVZ1_9NEOP|nr:unnamed protein product [Timema bartmani]
MSLEEQLVETVREHSVLYDTRDEAKSAWITLRDAYRSSLKRMKSSRSGSEATFSKAWKYSEQMSFLQPYMKDRPRHTNERAEINEFMSPCENIDSENSQPQCEEETVCNEVLVKKSKKVKPDPTLDFLREQASIREAERKRREELRRDLVPKDGLKLFFDSMYEATKQLSPDLQKSVKRKLFAIVSEAEDFTMGKIMKSGKVVLVLSGRYAGKKAIVMRNFDDGTSDKQYGHALVAGIDRYPRKIHKRMGKAKMHKRSKIKPFIKVLNYNHLMPTRYTVDIPWDKTTVKDLKDPMKRKKTRFQTKVKFEERYKSGKNKWFFQKLRWSAPGTLRNVRDFTAESTKQPAEASIPLWSWCPAYFPPLAISVLGMRKIEFRARESMFCVSAMSLPSIWSSCAESRRLARALNDSATSNRDLR